MCRGHDERLQGHCGPSFSGGAGTIWLSGFITGLETDFCPGGFLLDYFQAEASHREIKRDLWLNLRVLSTSQVVMAEQMQAVLFRDCLAIK